MKVIFLNIWGGKVFEPLMEFLKESAESTDFFCFQEVIDSPLITTVSFGGRTDIRKKLISALPQFEEYYAPSHNALDQSGQPSPDIFVGLAIFAKKGIAIETQGKIHDLQYLRFKNDGKFYTLGNFHGTAHPGSKLDTEKRLEQSKKIVEFLSKEKGEKILGGDFNLLPETESIRIIEKAEMQNLVREFKIHTTRSELSYARYPENQRQYFSDYVFISPGVRALNFTVPQIEVSDHLPMALEFS